MCVMCVEGKDSSLFFLQLFSTEQDRLAGLAVSRLPVQSYHLTHDVFMTECKNRPAICTLNRNMDLVLF